MKSSKLLSLSIAAAAMSVVSLNAVAYTKVAVHNNTEFNVFGEINYAGCRTDRYQIAPGAALRQTSNRGGCLVTRITGTVSGKARAPNAKAGPVQAYTSSGTSYSEFFVQDTGNGYRVYSAAERVAEQNRSREGKSPGFAITNNTIWPVAVALEQVGCLYYDTLKPGETFNRDTGAVWFTIKANIQADGKEPRTDWDCVKPVAAIVGTIIIGAATAGVAAFVALPAGAGILAAGSAAAALAPIATSSALVVAGAAAGGAAGGASIAAAAKLTAQELGARLEPNSEATIRGQYAGPDWPFRCDKKPVYSISGGWGRTGQNDKGDLVIDPGTPLRITKTNNCGNSMM